MIAISEQQVADADAPTDETANEGILTVEGGVTITDVHDLPTDIDTADDFTEEELHLLNAAIEEEGDDEADPAFLARVRTNLLDRFPLVHAVWQAEEHMRRTGRCKETDQDVDTVAEDTEAEPLGTRPAVRRLVGNLAIIAFVGSSAVHPLTRLVAIALFAIIVTGPLWGFAT